MTVAPVITFSFAQAYDFNSITFYLDDSNGTGGVRPPQSVSVNGAVAAVPDSTYIFLANGTFTGAGNVDVTLGGVNAEGLHIVSLSGDPDSCIIDLQDAGRAFYLHSGEGPDTTIADITIKRAYTHPIHVSSETADTLNTLIYNHEEVAKAMEE